MPTRPLPRRLVEWLSRPENVNWIDSNFGKLRNIDHRQNEKNAEGVPRSKILRKYFGLSGIDFWGFRIRAISPLDYGLRFSSRPKSNRNFLHFGFKYLGRYPRTGIVLKRSHDVSAEVTIKTIQSWVTEHRQSFGTVPEYVLQRPFAYTLSEKFLVMSRTKAPSIEEILNDRTSRGKAFFQRLKDKNRVTEDQLEAAFGALVVRTKGKMTLGNTLLLGFRGGKFIFMPLVDLH